MLSYYKCLKMKSIFRIDFDSMRKELFQKNYCCYFSIALLVY